MNRMANLWKWENMKKINSTSKTERNESGRSMVETLGVLAIIGVLAVAATAGIFFAVCKNKANTILRDSKIVFMAMKTPSTQSGQTWQSVQYTPVSGKDITVRRDFMGRDYVKVADVSYGVCHQLINMKTENVLYFYHSDNTELTSCNASNDIIIDWNGFGPPAVCKTIDDCLTGEAGASFEGICDAKNQCTSCPENQTANDTEDGCVCDLEKSVSCTKNGTDWCCGPNLICGSEVNECIESNLLCSYNFYSIGAPGTTFYTDCSVTVSSKANVQEYSGDCNYVVQATGTAQTWTDGTGATKTYYLPKDGGTRYVTGQKCSGQTYCSLLWTDSDGDGVWGANDTKSASANATGVIWGKCQMLSSFDQNPIAKYTSGYGLVSVSDGCEPNQYCAVVWNQSSWSVEDTTPTASANATGTLYGRCQILSSFEQKPLSKNETGNTQYQVVRGCPASTYCHLNWSTNTAECTTANANATGTIYGVCSGLKEKGSCPYAQ